MMACTARTLFSNTATFSRRSFRCRMSVGASDFQHGNNDIPHRKQSLALSLAKFNFSTSVDSRRSRRFCQDEFRRDFSTTPKPFSRKKNVKTTGEAEADKREFEPSLSFNYQATIAIMDIARAVSPVISMNAGFTLTSNFDLRTNGTSPTTSETRMSSLLKSVVNAFSVILACSAILHLHILPKITAFDLALEGVPVQLELNTAGRGQQTSLFH